MKIKIINIYIYLFIMTFMTIIEIHIRGIESGFLALLIRNFIAVFVISGSLLEAFTLLVYKKKSPLWMGFFFVIFLTSFYIQSIGIVTIYINTKCIQSTPRLFIMTLIGDGVALISFTLIHLRHIQYEKLLKHFRENNS